MAKRRRKTKRQFRDEDQSSDDEEVSSSFELTDDLLARIEEWAREAAGAEGLVLIDLEVLVRGRWIFRVFVERPGDVAPGEGVNVDECAEVSRYLEAYMDAEDAIPEDYVLEVSSPGVERELKKSRHLDQAAGKKIQLIVREQVDGKNKVIGRLQSYDDGILRIELEDADEPVEIDWDIVKKAQLKYDFDF